MGESRKNFVGIDLGTTYSSISILDEQQKPQPLKNARGRYITPSVVFFPEEGLPPIVGGAAISPGCEQPERFVEHAKRFMGSPKKTWEVDGVPYTPVDISAIILAQ